MLYFELAERIQQKTKDSTTKDTQEEKDEKILTQSSVISRLLSPRRKVMVHNFLLSSSLFLLLWSKQVQNIHLSLYYCHYLSQGNPLHGPYQHSPPGPRLNLPQPLPRHSGQVKSIAAEQFQKLKGVSQKLLLPIMGICLSNSKSKLSCVK